MTDAPKAGAGRRAAIVSRRPRSSLETTRAGRGPARMWGRGRRAVCRVS